MDGRAGSAVALVREITSLAGAADRLLQGAAARGSDGSLASVVGKPRPVHRDGVFAATDLKEGDIILRWDDSPLVIDENPLREDENVCYCEWLPDGRAVYVEASRWRTWTPQWL